MPNFYTYIFFFRVLNYAGLNVSGPFYLVVTLQGVKKDGSFKVKDSKRNDVSRLKIGQKKVLFFFFSIIRHAQIRLRLVFLAFFFFLVRFLCANFSWKQILQKFFCLVHLCRFYLHLISSYSMWFFFFFNSFFFSKKKLVDIVSK